MAFSDLCKISNAYKAVENEPDQSERIMEENSMVRDLITKILDEGTGPPDPLSSPEKPLGTGLSTNTTQYPNTSTSNFTPPSSSYNTYQDNYTFPQSEQNGYGFNIQNGFNANGFVNYESDVSTLLGIEQMAEPAPEVSPEQLNLLRLAAQEIGGAQFTSPTAKFDNYNFFEPSQRNSLPEANMFAANNFNRPNSLNLDSLNYNANLLDSNPYSNNAQRFPNKFSETFLKEGQNTQDSELLSYLNQLNMSDRPREEVIMQNNMADFKMPMEMNGHFNEDHFNKMAADDRNKMFFNRNFQPPQKNFNGENNYYLNEMMKNMGSSDKSYQIAQNFDFNNQPGQMPNNFKPNGFQQQNEFMQRRDVNQMMPREGFQGNGPMNEQRGNYGSNDNMQQAAMMRQNQELARQMSLLMRNRPPPNQLNVDVSFLHENAPFNMGLGALLGPSPPGPPPVLPSPMLDLPLLAPFYAMRNMRTANSSSAILHARLDACYEQWRQLERERKRTEARLALSFPGRAVSSSNSIPVPRLPPCPTRVDRLTVDMLREHTKVLTLMGKMETLRASVCVAQNKRANTEVKLTVLKRGQDDVPSDKEETPNMHIAPHSEVESAMLAWRGAVAGVQAARRRELSANTHRLNNTEPILQLADAVKQLAQCARRARCAMWCDLTVTVALAPNTAVTTATNDKPQSTSQASPPKTQEASNSQATAKLTNSDTKEAKPQTDSTKTDAKTEASSKTASKQPEKPEQKSQQRRTQNYRHKVNQQGRIDFFAKNQGYGGTRFMHNRHPYHYLATGPIN